MATAATIHAALVTAIEAVTGLAEAAIPWSLDAWPDSGFDGGFIVQPTGDDGGAFGGSGAARRSTYVIHLPWRLTGAPDASMQSALTKVEAVRAALRGVIGGARVQPGAFTPAYSSDGHTVDLQIDLEAYDIID